MFPKAPGAKLQPPQPQLHYQSAVCQALNLQRYSNVPFGAYRAYAFQSFLEALFYRPNLLALLLDLDGLPPVYLPVQFYCSPSQSMHEQCLSQHLGLLFLQTDSQKPTMRKRSARSAQTHGCAMPWRLWALAAARIHWRCRRDLQSECGRLRRHLVHSLDILKLPRPNLMVGSTQTQ